MLRTLGGVTSLRLDVPRSSVRVVAGDIGSVSSRQGAIVTWITGKNHPPAPPPPCSYLYNDMLDAYLVDVEKFGEGNFSIKQIGREPASLGAATLFTETVKVG